MGNFSYRNSFCCERKSYSGRSFSFKISACFYNNDTTYTESGYFSKRTVNHWNINDCIRCQRRFPYLISSGVYYAPASDAGALAPGMLPFWTALFAFIIVGERPTKLRSLGLIIILFGAFLVGSYSILRASNGETWKGHFLFLAGSGMWSMYSVYFRKSGINPLIGLVFGLFWGSVIAVPTLIIFGDVTFAKASNFDIISMIFLQGILIAIVAMLLYNFAVQQLGAPQQLQRLF